MTESKEPSDRGANSFEDLLVEALGALEDGGTAGLDGLLERQPVHASAVRARIAELGRLGLVDSESSRAGARAERMGDFRLISELGGGGMGVVFEAEQESLQRRVALKLIRPELLWFGGSRARFRREIESVARLSHPGIVPIYTVGEEQGVPFFAMELVEGCTLAQVIVDLQAKPVSKLTGADLLAAVQRCSRRTQAQGDTSSALALAPDASWNDTVVRLMRQVAEALEHTHSRGVVHRDIKPSNIVVTRTGRAMLIDFGLASKEGSERITRSGSAGGSMAYMSPEQVRGEEVDARTDIYSLGVSFAEMLTLQPVFKATSVDLLWRAILDGVFRKPREIVPGLPWDVETVCLTAMEADRERRYPTAGDLARDLSNLLARRPIDARRAGWMLRSLRWAQRHPRLSAALLAGGALGLVGALAYARQQQVLGSQVREQRDVALARAEDLRKLATGFVFDVHEKISRLPGATEAREQVVTQAQALFDALAKASAQDPTLAHDLAFVDLRLGTILDRTQGGTLGQSGSAREHLERAFTYFAALAGNAQASLEDRRLLCQSGLVFGSFLSKSGEAERAAQVLAGARENARALAQVKDAGLEDSVRLATLSLYLGQNEERRGRSDEAQVMFESGWKSLDALDQAHPGELKVLRLLPRACLLFANRLEQGDQPERSIELFERGIAAGDRLLALEPIAPENRRTRANCLEGLGAVLLRVSRFPEARERVQASVDVYESLRREDPRDGQLVIELTRALSTLSDACSNCGAAEEALAACTRALEVLDSAPASGTLELGTRRMSTLVSLSSAQDDLGKTAEALSTLQAADAMARQLDGEHPRDLYITANWAQLLREWAEMLRASGDTPQSVQVHRRALEAYARWRDLAQGRGTARSESAYERALYARALYLSGEDAAGLAEYRVAALELAASIEQGARDPMLLGRAAFGLLEAMQALGESGADAEACVLAERAWGYLEALAELGDFSSTNFAYARVASAFLAASHEARADAATGLDWRRRGLALRGRLASLQGAAPMELVLVAKEWLDGEPAALRDATRALALCELAVQRVPDQAVPRYYLAKSLRANGQPERALACAREALERVDANDPAQAKLQGRLRELIDELD